MRLTVLGCYGGIGGLRRTTALLLDDDILIDVGSGAGDNPPIISSSQKQSWLKLTSVLG